MPLGGDGVVPTGATDVPLGSAVTLDVQALMLGAEIDGLEVQLVVKLRAQAASSGVTVALVRVRPDGTFDFLEGTRVQQVAQEWNVRASGWSRLGTETPTLRMIGRSQGGVAGGILGATLLIRESARHAAGRSG